MVEQSAVKMAASKAAWRVGKMAEEWVAPMAAMSAVGWVATTAANLVGSKADLMVVMSVGTMAVRTASRRVESTVECWVVPTAVMLAVG